MHRESQRETLTGSGEIGKKMIKISLTDFTAVGIDGIDGIVTHKPWTQSIRVALHSNYMFSEDDAKQNRHFNQSSVYEVEWSGVEYLPDITKLACSASSPREAFHKTLLCA